MQWGTTSKMISALKTPYQAFVLKHCVHMVRTAVTHVSISSQPTNQTIGVTRTLKVNMRDCAKLYSFCRGKSLLLLGGTGDSLVYSVGPLALPS